MSFDGPLFVVGMPRSGTKLLRDLLNRHPRIAIPPAEAKFLPYLLRCMPRYGDLRDFSNFRRFYDHITRTSYFCYRNNYRSPLSAEAWYRACREFSAAGVFEALLRGDTDAPIGGNVIWGDKCPAYVDDIDLIARLYPSVKFIHIIRDVRDYCLSMNVAWKKDMIRVSQRWVDDVERARVEGRGLGPNAYIKVRYEDVVSDPARELRRLCDFMQIPFDPSMTTLERPSENLGDTKGEARVVKDNFGKFRTKMPLALFTRIEAIAGETLLACGYALTGPRQARKRVPPWTMRVGQIQDGWHLLRSRRQDKGLLARLQAEFRYFFIGRSKQSRPRGS